MIDPTPNKLAGLLFAVTIGIGAFLLFQVQFILGKEILPWFGGVPGVWTTCMLFFQVLLLAGYGYAHVLGNSPSSARQSQIHVAALVLALGLLVARVAFWPAPIIPSAAWKPGSGDDPIVAILGLLLFTIGLPYFILSTTGPLLQNWFSRCFPGRSPYRLFALSNLGSLLGLLSYPFLLEPQLTLAAQGWFWSAGFLVFAVCCGGCAVLAGRAQPLPATHQSVLDAPPPTRRRRALWFGLAMVASVMLLATTSQISLEVAVIPFLWMAPLSLYLVSFILCFEYERSYHRGVWIPILLLGAGVAAVVIRMGIDVAMLVQLVVYLVTLFAACMVCHGEIARHKPPARHLTGFYLYVSAGGAAGGVFSGVLAPILFPDLWELPLALVAACVLSIAIAARAGLAPPVSDTPSLRYGQAWRRLAKWMAFVYLLTLTGVLAYHARTELVGYIHVDRNFFGVLRVDEYLTASGKLRRRLKHGRIIHGLQFTDPALARTPTSYYGPGSGVGLAINNHPRRLTSRPMKLGFVGLGAGTLASYATSRDSVRFYEINPDVVALSTGPTPIFTYVRDCLGPVEIALGDARINLERESPQQFQVLVLDAFSSDAIPAHLLTLEAGRLYLRHLADDGILAIHISNRHLDLDPVVRGLADALGLVVVRVDNNDSSELVSRSDWMLLARQGSVLAAPEIQRAASKPAASKRHLLWTDSFSNLLQVFKG